MRRFLSHRWPWLVSTLVHGVAVAALVFNLFDSRSKAANVPAQIEMALVPLMTAPTMPQPDQAKPVEPQRQDVSEAKPEELKEQRPEEVKAVDPIPLVEPMPQLAEVQEVLPVETKAVPPPPPQKPKPPTPVVAKTPPAPPAPPVEMPVQAAPAPVAAAPMPPQVASLPPSAGRPGADAEYFSVLLAWLEEHKEYPRQAQARRQQGTAVLYFELDRQGHVLSYRIKTSSGVPELDREVEAMIRRAEPLPPMPADMTQAKLELQVPVQFRLR